jgi:hypothetical protein
MWNKVIEISAPYSGNEFVNHSLNRALFHVGRLPDDMFKYQQNPFAVLLFNQDQNPICWWWTADTHIDLGQLNYAESLLALAMDTYGERPMILKRLALVTMAKGDISTSQVYLGALKRTLFDSQWAQMYLDKIEQDPNLSTDSEIQRLRSVRTRTDRFFRDFHDYVFLDLLDSNKNNRMAFEYLTSLYMLSVNFDKLQGVLGRLSDFDYPRIPRAYEEAMLLINKRAKKIVFPEDKISPETKNRFNGFMNTYTVKYASNKAYAYNELAGNYKDTYFFYCLYGPAGMKK